MQRYVTIVFQSPYGDLGNTTLRQRRLQNSCLLFQSPYGDLGNTTFYIATNVPLNNYRFQSPYGDLGNTTDDLSFSTEELFKGFSPLTGIWVIRHCLSVPALGAGPQAIFSNLRLFSPFSETRVKNKIWAVSFFPLVTPFAAVFEIFKPRRFFLPKSVFFRLTYYPYLYLVYFF